MAVAHCILPKYLCFGCLVTVCFVLVLFSACTVTPWNNPHSQTSDTDNVLYASFSERPKHLDPVRAYSENEYRFIAQIYEPPLQYHLLKRPYSLVPLTAVEMPKIRYLNAQGDRLKIEAESEEVAYSEYVIRIKPGIRYQPHPAFARDAQGRYFYHALEPKQIKRIHTLADFAHMGSRELVAADYVYQIKRLADPTLHSPIAGVMAENIVGFSDFRKLLAEYYRRKDNAANTRRRIDLRFRVMEGVEAIDKYSYRIRLKGKYPQFSFWLAMPFFAPMPWEAVDFYAQPGLQARNITLNWYPVGTGPYMLAENNPNLRMVLERNPYFHDEFYPVANDAENQTFAGMVDEGKPLPFIDKAIYSLEKESIPYWNKFLQGYYDSSKIASDSFDQAVRFDNSGGVALTPMMQAKGIRLVSAVRASVYYMGFNMLDPIVGGETERARLLRRALSIAVDYEEFISIFTNGRGIAAQGPLPPAIFGYRSSEKGMNPYVYKWVDGRPQRRSIEEARQLLQAAGYRDGIDAATGQSLILYFDTIGAGPDAKARLNWMRKQFAKLGIQLVVRNTDYNRFQDKMSQGTAQIYQWGWNADYPDPENFLFLLYGPNSKVGTKGENASNYRNPEYDRLFEQMKNMANGPRRKVIIDRMIEILRQDAPWLFGFHPKAFTLYHAWYHNEYPNMMANNTLKYRRIDPELRQQLRTAWNQPVLWPVVVLGAILVVSFIPAIISYRRRERSAAL